MYTASFQPRHEGGTALRQGSGSSSDVKRQGNSAEGRAEGARSSKATSKTGPAKTGWRAWRGPL